MADQDRPNVVQLVHATAPAAAPETPPAIIEMLENALHVARTGYMDALGICYNTDEHSGWECNGDPMTMVTLSTMLQAKCVDIARKCLESNGKG